MANNVPFAEQHRLSSVDSEAERALCQVCGPVGVTRHRRGRWQCDNRAAEEKKYDQEYAQQHASDATRERKRELYHQKHWKRAIEKRYGLPEGWYDVTLIAQEGVCAVCLRDNPNRFGKYDVDHCHEDGSGRGLLCRFCNLLLGFANDDPVVLENAAAYLRSRRC